MSDTYTLTMHCEATALAHAAIHGEKDIVAITGPNCHMCKQLIYESSLNSGIDVAVIIEEEGDIKQIPISEMMPYAWPEPRLVRKTVRFVTIGSWRVGREVRYSSAKAGRRERYPYAPPYNKRRYFMKADIYKQPPAGVDLMDDALPATTPGPAIILLPMKDQFH